uniref:Uncharacterized protein n=1 Tax=Anguilla anguilla TaxID=7936 RepID=A0A0E9U3P3_ANGAN
MGEAARACFMLTRKKGQDLTVQFFSIYWY